MVGLSLREVLSSEKKPTSEPQTTITQDHPTRSGSRFRRPGFHSHSSSQLVPRPWDRASRSGTDAPGGGTRDPVSGSPSREGDPTGEVLPVSSEPCVPETCETLSEKKNAPHHVSLLLRLLRVAKYADMDFWSWKEPGD